MPETATCAGAPTQRCAAIHALIAALLALLALAAPALWNGYPLLQYDTGGYLARWHEGYLVPSRSTAYGIFLHLGAPARFWFNVAAQSAATVFVVFLALGKIGVRRPAVRGALIVALCLTTALPFLSSLLLTDIFAGLGVLAIYLLAVAPAPCSRLERGGLGVIIAFAAASHSATFGLLAGLSLAGWVARIWLGPRLVRSGLILAGGSVLLGAALLLATNFALSGHVKWTPGGYGILFGRLLENGTVKPYLEATCPRVNYKLCAYRAELPDTADAFLWGHSAFDKLGRFSGLGDEMRTIVIGATTADPLRQTIEAMRASGQQLMRVATGEGTHNQLWHTYAIMERYLPAQVAPMRAARQQRGELHFDAINAVHVPAAFLSMAGLIVLLLRATARRQRDALTLLAGTAVLALLGNAVLCGALSGPHPRYGARLVWIGTFVMIAAVARAYERAGTPRPWRLTAAVQERP